MKTSRSVERSIAVEGADVAVSSTWTWPPATPERVVVLAHGAGNDMHHPFMRYFRQAFATRGALSVTFNFPYKERGRKLPDRAPVLQATWRAILDSVRRDPASLDKPVYLAGKSMGGRMASLLVAQHEDLSQRVAGLIFLGYPLHPANKPTKLRVDHFPRIHVPLLFVQGSRDALCDLDLLQSALAATPAQTEVFIVADGDHSFHVPKRSGRSDSDVLAEVAAVIAEWMRRLER